MGFVMQGAFLALFLTAGAKMQKHLGIPGLVLSELMFLVVAVLYCLIRGVKLKEMFPVRKITVADFFGTVFLGIASFLLAMVCIGISLCVLPVSVRKEVSGLNEFLYGRMGYLPIVLIVAVLPAICEEAMERGCVLSHFRSIKKDWVIVMIMGLFFGIMHWSPLRFLNTAVMGGCLSYLLVKKNNILLPMILHFGNNFVSASIGYLSNSSGLTGNSDLRRSMHRRRWVHILYLPVRRRSLSSLPVCSSIRKSIKPSILVLPAPFPSSCSCSALCSSPQRQFFRQAPDLLFKTFPARSILLVK